MRKSQWYVLSGGFLFVAYYFYWNWSLLVPCGLDDVYCIAKQPVYGSIFQIASVFGFLFLICGMIEYGAERKK